jgi:hypothetical protein
MSDYAKLYTVLEMQNVESMHPFFRLQVCEPADGIM